MHPHARCPDATTDLNGSGPLIDKGVHYLDAHCWPLVTYEFRVETPALFRTSSALLLATSKPVAKTLINSICANCARCCNAFLTNYCALHKVVGDCLSGGHQLLFPSLRQTREQPPPISTKCLEVAGIYCHYGVTSTDPCQVAFAHGRSSMQVVQQS